MTDTILTTQNLTKEYRGGLAVDSINLSVTRGSACGILGPNASGKSTLIDLLAGAISPTRGTVNVDRQRVGYMSESPSYGRFATALKVLQKHGQARGLRGSQLDGNIADTLALTGLASVARDRVRGFTPGQTVRLSIAVAVLSNPELLLLDDPFAQLDPLGRREIVELLLKLKTQGHTLVIASQCTAELERLCDDVVILKGGHVAKSGHMDDLLAYDRLVELQVVNMTDAAMGDLRAIAPKFKMFGMPPTRFSAYVNGPDDVPAIALAIVRNGVRLLSLVPRRETLEELFIRTMED